MRAASALVIAAAAAALSLSASVAGGATGLRFSSFPPRALQGSPVSVTVAVPKAGDVCALGVAYADGSKESLSPRTARSGQAMWTWKVPRSTKTGLAHLSVTCKQTGRIARSLMVVGVVVPPKIEVVKQGFSIKPSTHSGDTVSYGVLLSNASKTDDALNVSVLVNFVNSSNVLVGSASTVVKSIRAGSEYALGRSLRFPAAAPVSRLEVVIRVGGRQPTGAPPPLSLDNVRIVPDLHEPVWVGSVEGELSNRAPKHVLLGASISAVVLDASGNIVGGGTGTVSGTLPPGAREFVKLVSGFTSIPTATAASARFTIEPRYDTRRT